MSAHHKMIAATESESYLQSITTLTPHYDSPAWLHSLRIAAATQAEKLHVPTLQDENWRFTDLVPLLKYSFRNVTQIDNLSLDDIQNFIIPEAEQRIVFVNGRHAPLLSSCPDDVLVSTLKDAIGTQEDFIRTHLAHYANSRDERFSAENTSHLEHGIVVNVEKNKSVAKPIHMLFITTSQADPIVTYPRCLVIAQSGSQCTLIEDYVSLDDNVYFSNAVTEIVVQENAQVTHIRLQRESNTAFHIAECAVNLGRGSRYISNTISLGARFSRYNLNIVQQAENTECVLDGLALIADRQVADTHTFMDHAQAHGNSRQLHKCIVDDAAHAVFNGKVMVREGAQLTDSVQSNRNLLLSTRARVDTKPQLEIFADDVKCAHGATVGQLDADELFYLKSRGLNEIAARNLLTYAFAAEIIDRIPVNSIKDNLRKTVLEKTHSQVSI